MFIAATRLTEKSSSIARQRKVLQMTGIPGRLVGRRPQSRYTALERHPRLIERLPLEISSNIFIIQHICEERESISNVSTVLVNFPNADDIRLPNASCSQTTNKSQQTTEERYSKMIHPRMKFTNHPWLVVI